MVTGGPGLGRSEGEALGATEPERGGAGRAVADPAVSGVGALDLAWEDPWPSPHSRAPAAPAAPMLHLEGFDGPMDLLLDLVERQRIDLGRLSIRLLVEQFLAASEQLRDRVPLERRADWLVMATRLVLLRSRLLFPESPEAAQAAEEEAAAEVRRLDELVALRAMVAWLADRPILGETVFARGQPESLGLQLGFDHSVDVIGFLWACLPLFDDDEPGGLEVVTRYRPAWGDLYSVAEARDRILRLLAEEGAGAALDRFLPELPMMIDGEAAVSDARLHRASAWATTFSAGLELAKQGAVALAQDAAFAKIQVTPPA